jgi:pimeloyl-ACP methyl ester carboxylesterase
MNASTRTESTQTAQPVETGYVPVGDLRVYYEVYGDGGTPLLLLHGGLFDIELQFGALLPGLSAGRRVIAIDLQGHGRTNDVDRPLSASALASDVVEVLSSLNLSKVDVFGNSLGGAVAIELAVEHPELVRKLIVASASFSRDGERGQNTAAVAEMTVDMLAGTPMEQVYLAKSPHPDHEHLQRLLEKIGGFMEHASGWSDEQIRGIAAPTLITVGDCDIITIEHAAKFLRLRGGDVNGDFDGVPESQLAVFPGTTHFFGMARTDLVLGVVIPFLDAAQSEA